MLAVRLLAGGVKLDVLAVHCPTCPDVKHGSQPLSLLAGWLRRSLGRLPILRTVQTPDDLAVEPPGSRRTVRPLGGRAGDAAWAVGEQVAWVAGLVLAVSAFTGWYSGSGDFTLSVTGWHTGVIGKLVFFIGLAVVLVVALRRLGVDLPAAVPESLLVLALGSLATILVLVRVISVPEEFLPAEGRGVGLWVSLAAAVAVIVGGLLRASEEL